MKKLGHIVFWRNFYAVHCDEQHSLNHFLASYIHATGFCYPDVELALDHFCKSSKSVVDKHTLIKKYRVQNRASPWFLAEISSLLNEGNKAWTLAKHAGCAEVSVWLLKILNLNFFSLQNMSHRTQSCGLFCSLFILTIRLLL